MDHYIITIEKINSLDSKKTYVINQYEKDKVESIIQESLKDNQRNID